MSKTKSEAKIDAYLKQVNSGKMSNDASKILGLIYTNPDTTLLDVEKNLKMLMQTASARISDLMDMGAIYITGEIEKGERKFSTYKYEKNPARRSALEFQRREHKLGSWIELGLNSFKDMMPAELTTHLQVLKEKYKVKIADDGQIKIL